MTEQYEVIERTIEVTKYLGFVSVDSGMLMVADPCYWIGDNGLKWNDYCEEVGEDASHTFKHKRGHDGKGIMVGNFGGDGCYSVYAITNKQGHQKRIIIDLDGSFKDEL